MQMTEINWNKIEEQLKEELDEYRFRHTLGVSYTAAALAMAYGSDVQKARLAGLLHDCAKAIPNSIRIPMCEENGISVTDIERENTSLLHSKLGVLVARRDYGVEDEDILGSIRWHTTGKPEMSLLEQIVYIADYIEPNRDYNMEIKSEIRKKAFTDPDLGCDAIMSEIVDYIKKSSKPMDEMTIKAYNYYHSKVNGKGE